MHKPIGTYYNARKGEDILVYLMSECIKDSIAQGSTYDEAIEHWEYNYVRDYTIIAVDDITERDDSMN